MNERDLYLADVARLREVTKKLPHVREEFMLDVASMSREELQKRCLIGSDWIGSFHACLDGIPEIRCCPGAGIEGCRDPRTIRAIVEKLVAVCPLTFEKSYKGVPKPIAAAGEGE